MYIDISDTLRLTLEKIRFSITRLKQVANQPFRFQYITWKDKILDYEIETIATGHSRSQFRNLKR